jgi:outer membrane receptor for ferrienterochelin and colicin
MWRYIGGSDVQPNRAASYLEQNRSLPAVSYIDLNTSYNVTKNLKLALTINNLFDKQAPFIGTGIGPGASNYGNTFPSVYDVIGRRFTLTGTATF